MYDKMATERCRNYGYFGMFWIVFLCLFNAEEGNEVALLSLMVEIHNNRQCKPVNPFYMCPYSVCFFFCLHCRNLIVFVPDIHLLNISVLSSHPYQIYIVLHQILVA